MFKLLIKKRGQSTMEYAILIIIIIAALLSIQMYIKRSVQGRLKSAADDIGDQFSPGNTNAEVRTESTSQTRETFVGGVTRSQLTGVESTNLTTSMNIINVEQEFWGSPLPAAAP